LFGCAVQRGLAAAKNSLWRAFFQVSVGTIGKALCPYRFCLCKKPSIFALLFPKSQVFCGPVWRILQKMNAKVQIFKGDVYFATPNGLFKV
jgi:hypothetical protein